MAQYQSFPGAAGDSMTLDKLKALRLPSFAGKRFLDVGCNEGFFCGYAIYDGASRSVGLDQSALFIERARKHFPQCEFVQSSWDTLPEGPFDVILLASALHYAHDQAALIHTLVDCLAPDGVLVLELGIAPSPRSDWVKVTRGIDERDFPTMLKLREVLEPYAWKWMGPSISQGGDPVPRHVVHISRPRPLAYLLMQPPAYGKTSIARSLFVPAGVPVVSGDDVLLQIAKGNREAPDRLRRLVAEDYSPFRLDQLIRRAFNEGCGADLVGIWIEESGGGSFALDMYVPPEEHAHVAQTLDAAGYLPVTLNWDRVGGGLPSQSDTASQADAFYLSLVDPDTGPVAPENAAPLPAEGLGFLDEVSFDNQRLMMRGWAVDSDGHIPKSIAIQVGDRTLTVDNFERQIRQDVQRALGLPHALLGYRIVLDLEDVTARTIARTLRLQIPGGAVFTASNALMQMLSDGS